MASDPRLGTRNNPIHIDDECHETAGRETSPGMTALPMMPEGPTHGLPLDDFRGDDQETVATEVATPPPTLTEDMAEGNLDAQPPDIERAQEEENTAPGIPPECINAATIDGEHMSRRSSISVSQGTDPAHPVHPVPPNEVQESVSTPRPATSNYSDCNASGLAAVESSDALSTFYKFTFLFCPDWKITEIYQDNDHLDVRLQIPYAGARKRSAPEPEPSADGAPVEDSAPLLRRSKRARRQKQQHQ